MTNTGELFGSRDRIIAAAKHELQTVGILGLRVQEVANLANTSVALIYKHFKDRDGLLAQVLGDLHNERIDYWEKLFSQALSGTMPRGEYSVEQLLANLPLPNSEMFQSLAWDRVQMLAALGANPKLRERIEQTTQRLFSITLRIVANADTSATPRDSNHRVIALVISSLNLIFMNNGLLGDQRITDDEYLSFLQAFFGSLQKNKEN